MFYVPSPFSVPVARRGDKPRLSITSNRAVLPRQSVVLHRRPTHGREERVAAPRSPGRSDVSSSGRAQWMRGRCWRPQHQREGHRQDGADGSSPATRMLRAQHAGRGPNAIFLLFFSNPDKGVDSRAGHLTHPLLSTPLQCNLPADLPALPVVLPNGRLI